ncbi:MAG: hypothetical protein U1A78_40040 [Polyangia bacterium]
MDVPLVFGEAARSLEASLCALDLLRHGEQEIAPSFFRVNLQHDGALLARQL